MADASGKRVIVFNGEIYNFSDLRRMLAAEGYPFRTRSDTEVILAAYDRMGIDCLGKLNGMFALALWDEEASKLFLVRDRLGIKPLYYTVTSEGAVIFSSEIKAILLYPGLAKDPNFLALSGYLSFRRPPGWETYFEGIYALEPGCFLELDAEGVRKQTYWSLPTEKVGGQGEVAEVEQECNRLFTLAVRRRMVADVPLGAFLSGGLDSTAVVAVMTTIRSEPVKTYSIGFAEEGFDELPCARLASATLGTDHHEMVLTCERYLDLIPMLIRYKDEPLAVANEVAIYELSRRLKRDITVVLSGEGADELFVGYGRIFRSPYDYARSRDPSFLAGSKAARFLQGLQSQYGRKAFADEVDHFLSLYRWLGRREKELVLSADLWHQLGGEEPLRTWVRDIFASLSHLDLADRYLYFFQRLHLENLLRRLDAMTMANSVEGRVPFVDHELVEFVSRLPFSTKLPWKSEAARQEARYMTSASISEVHDVPKYLLKRMMRGRLPEEIIARKKEGFPVPVHTYSRGRLGALARDVLLDPRTKNRGFFDPRGLEAYIQETEREGGHRRSLGLWMLLNVELWFRIYFDGVL